MAHVVMGVPWSQYTSLLVHDPISRLGMEPTTLSMGLPEETKALALQEPYVDHLIRDAYCPQSLSKPPW